jgi:quinol monooxygenase YgiN
MDNMCTVIACFYARPEKRQELEKILQEFVVQTRQEPGCIDYHLHQSDADPNVFVFYENWRSRGDWDLHNQKPFLKSFLDKRTDYLAKDIEVRTYTMRSAYDKPGHKSTEEVERS